MCREGIKQKEIIWAQEEEVCRAAWQVAVWLKRWLVPACLEVGKTKQTSRRIRRLIFKTRVGLSVVMGYPPCSDMQRISALLWDKYLVGINEVVCELLAEFPVVNDVARHAAFSLAHCTRRKEGEEC